MSITPLDSGDKEYLTDENHSVKKWWYQGDDYKSAQLIKDTYFEPSTYPHNVNITYTVEAYTWSCTNINTYDTELTLMADFSDKVISVSYDCDSSSNIKTSATLTLLVPPDDNYWYMNREYDIKYVSAGSGGTGQGNSIWTPQIYLIKEIIESKSDVATIRGIAHTANAHGNIFDDNVYTINKMERSLGFFLPESGGYSYDETTSTLTIQLQGLSYGLTSEYGNRIITPYQSFDYYFDMPYNNRPTQILSYRLESTSSGTGQATTSTTQTPVTKTKEDEEKEFVRGQESKFYNNISEVIKQKGIIFGTAPVVNQNNYETENKRINVPMPLTISGEDDNGLFKFYFGDDIAGLIYDIAMCRMDAVLNRYHLPLTGIRTPSDDNEMTSKGLVFPNGWEFENGVSVMDIAEKILEDKYYEPRLWVDEDRTLWVQPRPAIASTYRYYIPYRCYSELVVSEDISMDDSEFYTVVEVYGKDGEYYGVYDGSFDGFKIQLGNTSDSILGNMNAIWSSAIPKVQVITDDSIESDEECYQRAIYEAWKCTRGHTKITVKIQDNMIFASWKMSQVVGETFVEYRTMQGNGKTILCNLEKASLSDGVWTWELTPFFSYVPSYDYLGSGRWQRWKTEHYNEWIAYRYKTEWLDNNADNDITEQEKNTLAKPVILGWELIDGHILRLYITSIDIGLSVVKMYTRGGGSTNFGNFIGESVDTNGTADLPWGTPCAKTIEDLTDGQHIYKIFDYPITCNGTYAFVCELYSPYHESSTSSPYYIDVTGVYSTDESGEIHAPYLTDEYGRKLTDEVGNKLTI